MHFLLTDLHHKFPDPDIFTFHKLCLHLSELHSRCTPHDFAKSEEVVRGTSLVEGDDSLFEVQHEHPLSSKLHLDPHVVGSGCIAQVHRGTWQNYGENSRLFSESETGPSGTTSITAPFSSPRRVAVKILHPGVRETIAADLEILKALAWAVEYFLPFTRFMVLTEAVSQFSIILSAQTDLRREAEHTERFRKNFENYDNVRFPEIIFASKDLLVESFEEGLPMQELLRGWEQVQEKKDITDLRNRNSRQGGKVLSTPVKNTSTSTQEPAMTAAAVSPPRRASDESAQLHLPRKQPAAGRSIAANAPPTSLDEQEVQEVFARKASAGRWLNLFSWQEKEEKLLEQHYRKQELHQDFEHEDQVLERQQNTTNILRRKSRYSSDFLQKLSSLALNAYLKMLFTDRFVHGDLHPGNMFYGVLKRYILNCYMKFVMQEWQK